MTENIALDAILLVDDDKVTNLMHKRQIARRGLAREIAVATDGCSALEYLSSIDLEREKPPELILLDINMPRMNGFEFLEKYAALPEILRQAQHVVMVSTSTLRKDRERALDDPNVREFVGKPLRDADLIRLAEDYVASRNT